MLSEMQQSLRMDEEEFAKFRQSIVDPMIRRHEEMFPGMPNGVSLTRHRVPLPCRPPRERRGLAKSIPEPIVTRRVPAAAAKSTSSVAARRAADSRHAPGRCNPKYDGIRTGNTACPARGKGSYSLSTASDSISLMGAPHRSKVQ